MALNTSDRATLAALFSKMTDDDLDLTASLFKARRSSLSTRQTAAFYKGQQVSFESRSGETIKGIIDRVNKKTVSVIATSGTKWRVSPGFLKEM